MSDERLIRVLATPGEAGECKSCGAPVTWRVTYPNRKRMPFKGDPAAVKTETIDGVEVAFLPQSATHFADCPQSQQWSRKAAAKA